VVLFPLWHKSWSSSLCNFLQYPVRSKHCPSACTWNSQLPRHSSPTCRTCRQQATVTNTRTINSARHIHHVARQGAGVQPSLHRSCRPSILIDLLHGVEVYSVGPALSREADLILTRLMSSLWSTRRQDEHLKIKIKFYCVKGPNQITWKVPLTWRCRPCS
jgi:hypothetical protein